MTDYVFWLIVFACVFGGLAVAALQVVAWWRRFVESDPERAAGWGVVAIVALWVAGVLFETAVRL